MQGPHASEKLIDKVRWHALRCLMSDVRCRISDDVWGVKRSARLCVRILQPAAAALKSSRFLFRRSRSMTNALLPREVDCYARDGYLAGYRVFSEEEIHEINREFQRLLKLLPTDK